MKTTPAYTIVLLRHGQSVWNKANRFTGWTDVSLSRKGIAEAKAAADLLMEQGMSFDMAFTSYLKRSVIGLQLLLDKMDLHWIPVEHSWKLNERHYGALQGYNKNTMEKKVGAKQVFLWRRTYKTRPPLLDWNDKRHPRFEPKYAALKRSELPSGESLEDTLKRTLPYWKKHIEPVVKQGKRVIVAAHGNSLRAIIKYLDHISDEKIATLEIPTGVPLVYEFDRRMKPIRSYYLTSKGKKSTRR